ncbi:LacI family transcriptional regulator [Sinomonas cellulolyticus]|uniref:LacI family DNA-binding transcriptional regulator n=1 Tax=Sinomonas cellulolyticus TaxID=2801916 RepID=A0ABS1JY60_9MICC|nr:MULTISPECIES: LacI family DNA-binding transcriptional regulator [Sinomonas]MBL0704155.1 LacI family DNA-binding transcriptional regulator [Sinomonas cellulolyticus]GHG58004.1 LacI family transcriptional regulator [Sinomonas sp. KCTC 49339]
MPTDAAPRPTIYDVAQRAGVSKSLVSLVLRDAPHVSDARREAVLAAIEELGYRPSRAASVLASQRTRTVGVLIDDFHNPWFVELLAGLRSVLDPAGYTASVADLALESASGRNPVDGFLAMHVDALVLAADPAPGTLDGVAAPIVVAGTRDLGTAGGAGADGGLAADVVAGDDALGSRLATEHLIGLGHRKIGHLAGGSGPGAERRRGYEATMEEAGLVALVAGSGGTSEADGYAAACALLDAHPDVTGIVAGNDVMAVGSLAALRERGLSVPGDVSVVGHDDSPLASYRYLALTSVDGHSRDVGAAAARALLDRLDAPDAPPLRELLAPDLVVRGSTAPPRRSAPTV